MRIRDDSELQIRTFKTVVTENGCQKQMWRENGLKLSNKKNKQVTQNFIKLRPYDSVNLGQIV